MRTLFFSTLLIFFAFLTSESYSLPRFALRSGGNCIDCHVNPTGGEMRSDRGWNMSRKGLTMSPPDSSFKISNKIGENIRFGFDIRGQLLGTLGSLRRIDFQNMSGLIYTSVDLSEQMRVFARYDFENSVWEGYGIAQILPNNGYIKGGEFIPNFGIRLDDHTAYTRGGDLGFITSQKLGFMYDPYYVETGAEIGIYIADYAFLTASVGRPIGRPTQPLLQNDPSYTARLQFNPSLSEDVNLLFGGSYHRFRSTQTFNISDMYGPFVGIGIGNFTIMAEFDFAKSYLISDSTTTAAMIEGAYRITKGFDVILRYDRFVPSTNTANEDLSRVVIGLDFFPYPFMDVIPEFRVQTSNLIANNNAFNIQFHLFY
ncbi:MAG: hypothetical protein P4L27_05685 [Ignavibacteriaceae bacterium]|nr:hypothetical protein [Ignavibacteriaceae bacterium]